MDTHINIPNITQAPVEQFLMASHPADPLSPDLLPVEPPLAELYQFPVEQFPMAPPPVDPLPADPLPVDLLPIEQFPVELEQFPVEQFPVEQPFPIGLIIGMIIVVIALVGYFVYTKSTKKKK